MLYYVQRCLVRQYRKVLTGLAKPANYGYSLQGEHTQVLTLRPLAFYASGEGGGAD